MDLKSLEVDKQHIGKVQKNLDYNNTIANYYDRYMQETVNTHFINKLDRKLERLQQCNKFWQLDRYDQQKVKDFIKTNLCKDKFCHNCKKVKQAQRMAKFMPEIEKYKSYNMSQLVLTVPNVPGEDLRDTIKLLFRSCAKLIEYFKLKEKIKGIDFKPLGYQGAIRSLEVTYNKKEYHPHLHVLLVHSGDLGEKEHKNQYSYDRYKKKPVRLFSDWELLIQKIWYLLINGKRVVKSAIDGLEQGYSCMMDKFKEDDFLELFKYMTKADGDDSKMTFENFKDLYHGLLNVRQIQGYGCLFNIKDDDDMALLADERYNAILEALREKENPVSVHQTPQDLLNDYDYLLISRKKIFNHLRKL